MSTVKELIQYKEFAERHIQDLVTEHEAKLRELGAENVYITISFVRTDTLGAKPSIYNSVQVEVTL